MHHIAIYHIAITMIIHFGFLRTFKWTGKSKWKFWLLKQFKQKLPKARISGNTSFYSEQYK